MKKYNSVTKNQEGIVSIMVTFVILIIVTLIVLDFAIISRREQRQALDKQLSTQAFYAAESGINDLISRLTPTTATNNNCNNYPAGITSTEAQLNQIDSNIGYTCLLFESSPSSLSFSDVGTQKSIITQVHTTQDVNYFEFTWRANSNLEGDEFRGDFSNTTIANWKSTGILRVDIIPVPSSSGTVSSDTVKAQTQTIFMYPTREGTAGINTISATTDEAIKGSVVSGECTSTAKCKVKVNNINSLLFKRDFYIRIKAIYSNISVEITPYGTCVGPGCSPPPLMMANSQFIIDSTGKANNVLRRIKVAIPYQNLNNKDYPEYALESSDSICKRLVYDVSGPPGPVNSVNVSWPGLPPEPCKVIPSP